MLNQENLINISDEELVAKSLKNQDVFLVLMKRYEGKLISYIRRISSCAYEDAEDILQEVFIKVYKNLGGFDKQLKFSSWIYRITHNQVISNYRKLKARPDVVDIDISDLQIQNFSSGFDTEKEMDNKLDKEKILSVISKLDIKYREVLILKYIEEKDYQEISDILKKPKGTVATLLNRAKKKFYEQVKKDKIKF